MTNTSSRPLLRRVLTWTVRIVGALVALLVVGVGAVYGVTATQLSTSYAVKAHPIPVGTDSATLAHGAHVAATRGCRDCHAENFGGSVMADDPMLGRLVAANLTTGRPNGRLTPEAFELAVRHGLRPNGTALVVMPATDFNTMSDEDLGALYSYIQSLPPATKAQPAMAIGPIGRALAVAGAFELTPARVIAQDAPHVKSVKAEATPEYGKYLAKTCTGCHRPDFVGGPMPGPPGGPIVANLTPDQEEGIGAWSEDEFVTALTTGVRPDAPPINGEIMPLKMTKPMTETEKRAIYRYLRTVEAKKRPKS